MIRRPPRSTLFPTRRSSDLIASDVGSSIRAGSSVCASSASISCRWLAPPLERGDPDGAGVAGVQELERRRDRKSTRLNSSHSQISYAVFCLKKKKKQNASSA